MCAQEVKRAADGSWGGAAGLEAQISVVEQLSPFFWLSLLHLYFFFSPLHPPPSGYGVQLGGLCS